MTRDEFKEQFLATTDEAMLGICLRNQEVPYICEPKPNSWNSFRQQIAGDWKINEADVSVVGSGRLGFSLKPNNNLKAFSDKSDIDVAVVNETLFDELWLSLLAAAYPRQHTSQRLGGWLKKRQKEVYTGWVSPGSIVLDRTIYGTRAKPVNQFHHRWFTTLKVASKYSTRRHKDISARLYRSWRHAELYHLSSLADLRRSLKG